MADITLNVKATELNDVVNKAKDNFSNLKDAAKKTMDGQWVAVKKVLLSGVTFSANETKNIKIDDVIPNDGYSYELILSGYCRGNGVGGQITDIGLGDATEYYTYKNVRLFACVSYNSSIAGFASGATVIPIKSRTLGIYNTQTNTTGQVGLTLQAYRRLGTNEEA